MCVLTFLLFVFIINYSNLSSYLDQKVFSQMVTEGPYSSLLLSKSALLVLLIIMMMVFLVPEKLKYLSLLGVTFTLIIICSVCMYCTFPEYKGKQDMKLMDSPEVFHLIGSAIFCFENIPAILPLRYTLKDPHQMKQVFPNLIA